MGRKGEGRGKECRGWLGSTWLSFALAFVYCMTGYDLVRAGIGGVVGCLTYFAFLFPTDPLSSPSVGPLSSLIQRPTPEAYTAYSPIATMGDCWFWGAILLSDGPFHRRGFGGCERDSGLCFAIRGVFGSGYCFFFSLLFSLFSPIMFLPHYACL